MATLNIDDYFVEELGWDWNKCYDNCTEKRSIDSITLTTKQKLPIKEIKRVLQKHPLYVTVVCFSTSDKCKDLYAIGFKFGKKIKVKNTDKFNFNSIKFEIEEEETLNHVHVVNSLKKAFNMS